MPRMDGTGPNGQGAMTGGGFGRCNPNADPAMYVGRGLGRGRGNGRFLRRNMNNIRLTQADNIDHQEAASKDMKQDARVEELSRMVEELKAENKKLNKQLQEKKNK